jgi:hypothetical protein
MQLVVIVVVAVDAAGSPGLVETTAPRATAADAIGHVDGSLDEDTGGIRPTGVAQIDNPPLSPF